MVNLRHKIHVKNGKIEFYNLPLFNKNVRSYEGKDAFLVFRDYKDKRSDNQNRYYWGVVLKFIGEELGYFPEDIHEFLKQKLLVGKEITIGDVKFYVPSSSSSLNTTEFEDYLAKVRAWAVQELKLVIPLPNEVEY